MFRTRIFPTVAALAMKRQRVRKAAFMTLSQIGIRYRQSPLSRTIGRVANDAPAAGDRFPWLRLMFRGGEHREDLFERLDDTKFNLLVIGQPAPPTESLGLDDLLRTHIVPLEGDNVRSLAAVSITAPAYYLLRPDGHVGLAGTEADERELRRWFSDCHVHLRSAVGQEAGMRLGVV